MAFWAITVPRFELVVWIRSAPDSAVTVTDSAVDPTCNVKLRERFSCTLSVIPVTDTVRNPILFTVMR